MKKQGDIRKYCLPQGPTQGDGDSEEKEKAKTEKRRVQQPNYNKKNRKRTVTDTWVDEYHSVGPDVYRICD